MVQAILEPTFFTNRNVIKYFRFYVSGKNEFKKNKIILEK